jgi:transcriptional antiterminator RfaH
MIEVRDRYLSSQLLPLFPRYIFVGLDLEEKSWRSINGTRGISNLLMSSEIRPAILSQITIGKKRMNCCFKQN